MTVVSLLIHFWTGCGLCIANLHKCDLIILAISKCGCNNRAQTTLLTSAFQHSLKVDCSHCTVDDKENDA